MAEGIGREGSGQRRSERVGGSAGVKEGCVCVEGGEGGQGGVAIAGIMAAVCHGDANGCSLATRASRRHTD